MVVKDKAKKTTRRPRPKPITKDAEVDNTPRLTVTSLAPGALDAADAFDFFPHMNPRAAATREDRMIVEQLKDGSYQPYMTPLEFEASWGREYGTFSAAIKAGDHTITVGTVGTQFHLEGAEASTAAQRYANHVRRVGGGEAMAAIPIVSPRGLERAERDRLKELERMFKQNRIPIRRAYYSNPRQYYDHILLQDAYANTFAGEVIDALVDFIIGGGIYPAIVLRNPSGDPEQDKADLEEAQEAVRTLMAIDEWYSDMGPEKQDGYFDVPFEDKLRDLITSMMVFGRACMAKEKWGHLPKVKVVLGKKQPPSEKPDMAGASPFGGPNDKNKKDKPKDKSALGNAAVDTESDSDDNDKGGSDKPPKGKDGKDKGGSEDGLEEEEFKDLPNVLKNIHPIEMGLTEIELYTGKVAGIWISNDQPYLPADEMIYLVNSFASPMIGTTSYGFTRLQRCIDQTRLYRRLIARNFPQYLRTSSSGMGAFIMNTTGYPKAVRASMREAMRNLYRTGEIAVIDYANVDDFEWKEFKVTTDINALVEVEQAMLSTISTILGVPHSIVFDNAESRATLIGRIVTFMATSVKSARRRIGLQLAQQWWIPNLRVIKKDDPDFLKKYTIEVRFVEMSLETKLEKVERLLQETQLNEYKNSYLGEQLDDPDYEMHIDEEKMAEKKEQDDRMMEAEIEKAQAQGKNGPPGANGPSKKSGSGMDGSRRSNSKNGRPIGTDRSTMKRRSSSTSG